MNTIFRKILKPWFKKEITHVSYSRFKTDWCPKCKKTTKQTISTNLQNRVSNTICDECHSLLATENYSPKLPQAETSENRENIISINRENTAYINRGYITEINTRKCPKCGSLKLRSSYGNRSVCEACGHIIIQ